MNDRPSAQQGRAGPRQLSDEPFFDALRHPSPDIYSKRTLSQDVGAGSEADMAFTEQPPSLPGYDILDPLGHGGMGVVYKRGSSVSIAPSPSSS